jgi:hypothetical protein
MACAEGQGAAALPPGAQEPTQAVTILRFQPGQPLARARRIVTVSADLENVGDADVELALSLVLPSGVRVVESDAPRVLRLSAEDGWVRLTWKLVAAEPVAADLLLEVKTASGSPVASQPLRMLFLPPVDATSPAYIPEPEPVPTSMLVGAHHCPLWEADKPEMWQNLLKHPERTPALGLYAQENPEVSDWETKWAVEHGISFFIYCWYRAGQGGAVKTRYGSAIHDALFKSRFVSKMKFTIMWENQTRGQAGVSDENDLFTNLVPYWLENYFKHPSYLKVDNKPVLFIYRPEFLVDDLGGVTNVAKAFSRMRQVCREAGFDGLHLLGEYRGTDPKHLELMKSLGLDYTFAYCWYVPGSPSPEQAMQAQMASIRKTQELNLLPQVVTVSQAWSGWHDEGTVWKIPPPQFETLLGQAKAFTDTLPREQLGSRMLLLDNWNEWGEGHYLAPYREYGFGYLDAVRKVFSMAPEEHLDLLPEDVGRGPYDAAARAYFEDLERKSRLGKKWAVRGDAPAGLVAWWTFDEPAGSPVALDYSGHRNGGFLEKARIAPGFEGGALVCGGGSVLLPSSRSLGALQTFSVECRVKADLAGQDNRWIVCGVFGQNTTSGFRLGALRGKPCFQVPQTAWSHHLVGESPLPAGKWVHLAGTFDGSTMRLYLDGQACGTLARPGSLLPFSGRLVLGNYDVGHAAFFSGLLDDVRVYQRVLPAEEIRAHAAAGSQGQFDAESELRLANGTFDDLTGLSAVGSGGWYGGVPAGWISTAKDTCYSVLADGSKIAPVCNLSQLGFLLQEAGTLTLTSDVVLQFDVIDAFHKGRIFGGFGSVTQREAFDCKDTPGSSAVDVSSSHVTLGAALLDGGRKPLAHGEFKGGLAQKLVARNVPAGTKIIAQFWMTGNTFPALDNVTVATLGSGRSPEAVRTSVPVAGAGAGGLRQAASGKKETGVMGELDAAFRDPPNRYRVIQYNRHDGAVLDIEKMREWGIGGVMLFLSKHKYLRNEDAWANMKTNIRLAKEAGMQVWVADDNGYPSGQAGGLVVAANPAFELRVLTTLAQRGQGKQTLCVELPPSAETFVSAMLYPEKDGQPVYARGVPVNVSPGRVEATGLEGPWVLQAFARKINNDAGSPAMGTAPQFGNTGHYPNLLDAAAMAKFVELTHAEYARRLGPLTNQIDVFYCNEPHLGSTWHAGGERPGGERFLPWAADLPQRFQKEHGYDLMPLLPALFAGEGDEAKLVRRHFYQTLGNIFAENYTGRIARWAEAHGVRSGGHLLLEERMDSQVIGYGNLFQALQRQQVPGCDVAMPEPGDYWNYWMPRLISSAAQLQGREQVSVLIDPIVDRRVMTLQPSSEFMLRFINMAALLGVNQFTSYVFWERYPPEVYRRFNENVGRLGVMLTGARNVSNVAMYYPIETFQSFHLPSPKVFGEWLKERPEAAAGHDVQERVIRSLYRHGYDFSWLDGEAVLRAEIREGRLVIGAHAYTSLIMPRVELLPLAVLEKLRRFEAAGGKVLWVDSLPRLGDRADEHDQVRSAVATCRTHAPEAVVDHLGEAFPAEFLLRLDGKPDGLFITRWLQKGRRVNFVVNAAYAPLSATLRLEGQAGGMLWVYDPADGSIVMRKASGYLALEPNTCLFLVEQP